ncbi:MAG: hypothetical protein KJO03_06905 [Gammaproteobacteria bacterium]|nr:hypothetical protein [Gammaproteobacteria bacterium]
MISVKQFLLLPAAIVIMACTPMGSDPTQVELSDLAGLWDSSENNGVKKDLIYTRVSSAGAIIEYDFDGDEVDAGLNCYQVDTGALSVIADNRFLVTTDMHADKKFEVELEWLDAGNALKVYFIDENEPAKISSSQIWTRVADESILDDEPPCRR